MAATNIFRNISNLTINGITPTSVLEVQATDSTGILKDGSDNDASYTFTAPQPLQCRITVRLRDPKQAMLLTAITDKTMTFVGKNVATGGADVNVSIAHVSLTQPGVGGSWSNLGESTINGEGGAVTIT